MIDQKWALLKIFFLFASTFFICSQFSFYALTFGHLTNCVAKVLVLSFLYARSKPYDSRQNLHLEAVLVVKPCIKSHATFCGDIINQARSIRCYKREKENLN